MRFLAAADVLGDSLPPGPYRFTGVLPFRRDTVEVSAGTRVLTADPRPPLDGAEGLRVCARVAPLPADPERLHATVTVSNRGQRRVRFTHGGVSCSMRLLAYRARDPKRPAWQSRQDCTGPRLLAELGPGEVPSEPQLTRDFPVRAVLGDSLRPGRYQFVAQVELSGHRVTLPLGELRLRR